MSTAVLSREVKSGGDEHGGHAASRGYEPVWKTFGGTYRIQDNLVDMNIIVPLDRRPLG